MVYGVLRFINFAHSDVLMLGAFAAYYLAPKLAGVFPAGSYAGAGVVILLDDRQAHLALLVLGRVDHDGRARDELLAQHDLAWGGLTVASNDVATLVVTAALLAGMWFIVQHTKTGMAMRAVAFNEKAAALMGVNINRIISLTFALGSALAAVAGIFYALRAHGIEPLMGVQPGLRAFIAAVVGGIGNLPGAALGGLVIGLLETFAGGIPGLSNYRDGIAFAILILILLFKPAGLLGKSQVEKV